MLTPPDHASSILHSCAVNIWAGVEAIQSEKNNVVAFTDHGISRCALSVENYNSSLRGDFARRGGTWDMTRAVVEGYELNLTTSESFSHLNGRSNAAIRATMLSSSIGFLFNYSNGEIVRA